ncbi:MAG: purine-nucleoside phosphorylase [bacterium]|nr:purine-nucleoside phosphorylase [bacterium]
MEVRARWAADALRRELGIPLDKDISVGIILGTGWGEALPLKVISRVGLKKITSFEELGDLEGHAREVVYGTVGGVDVIVLRGRIHLNEMPPSRESLYWMVRIQTEMLLQLGVKTLIVTSAVGSLDRKIEVGDVVAVNGFVTLFAPPMPLWAGEFVSPEDTLSGVLRQQALATALGVGIRMHSAGHVMVRGPQFEGRRYDKKYLRKTGAKVVGMSMLPEACVAALYNAQVLGLGFVTNDAVETHSHEENIARAKASAKKLGSLLEGIIARISGKKVVTQPAR